MKIFRLLGAAILLCASLALGQTDNYISSGNVSPYLTLGRGLIWGSQGLGTVGQNFIFNPLDPNQGFCVFIFNNNPSSAHSFTLTVAQTGDPAVRSYQGNTQRWTNVPTTTVFPTSVPANSLIGINYKTTASAGIVISFTGNTTQAGSPDSADIFTVQTNQSSCGSIASNAVQGTVQQGNTETLSNQFPVQVGGLASPGSTGAVLAAHMGTNGNGWLIDGGTCCQSWASGFVSTGNLASATFSNARGAFSAAQEGELVVDTFPLGSLGPAGWTVGFQRTNFLEAATDQNILTQSGLPAFQVFGRAVNPTAGTVLLHHFNKQNSTVNPAYKDAIISCSVACEVFINRTSAQGTTCTALTIQNMQLGNGNTVKAANVNDVAENACTGAPTATYQMYDIQLGPGQSQLVDLSGFVNFHSSVVGGGIDFVENTTITGNAAVTLRFMEQ